MTTTDDGQQETAEALASHALVIGVSRYADLRKLPETEDAKDITSILRVPMR